MTAVHHLLVMRSECRRGRSRRSPRSCAGARSRASTVNRGRRFAAPLCAEPARRGASVSGAACTTLRETRHALARTLATPAGSRRSPQHRGLAPHRVRSRPGPGPSGPERRFDRPASGGTDVVRHRTWRTRALLAIGRITLSASPQRGLGVPLYDNSGVRTHGHRQALRRGGSPARPVHPVRSRPGVRRGRPPGRRTGPWALVNEAFAKRFGGGRRTVIGTRLQMTAIDVDDQGREIASASWSTCGHAGVTATAPTVFVPVERVPDDLLGQVHRGPNVQSVPLASRCRRASGLIVWSVANVAPGGDIERLGDCRGSPRSGSACTSAGTCASRRGVPPPAPPTGDADAWCSGRNPRVVRKTRKSLWHQMENGVWCSIPCTVGTRIAPESAGRRACCRRQMVSGFGQDIDPCVAVAWRRRRPLSNGRLLGQSVECGSDSWRLATVDSRR